MSRTPLTQGELEDFAAAILEASLEMGQLIGDAIARSPAELRPHLAGGQRTARAFYQDLKVMQQSIRRFGHSTPIDEDDLPGHLH